MAKVKLTKNELKSQRDALKRFQRYLPTLQLKKQQLQLEARQVRVRMDEIQEQCEEYRDEVSHWMGLLDAATAERVQQWVIVEEWRVGIRNIAGIDTPVFEEVTFEPAQYDLFTESLWIDDVVATVRKLIELDLHCRTLKQQLDLIEHELRVVTQRVNLFEKVKIPESRENIRRIQIYLGDQQTNAVGRAKIAKAKCEVRDAASTTAMAG